MIAALIEKLRRPALLGLVGKKLERQCRADLAGYFRHLGKAVKALHLGNLVEGNTKETAIHAVEMKLHNVLRLNRPLLKTILAANLTEGVLAGYKADVMHEADSTDTTGDTTIPPDILQVIADDVLAGKPLDAAELDYLGLTGQAAADWAEAHAGDLITGIDATTSDLIAQAIATGIEEQLGPQGTADLLTELLDTMSSSRAFTIARTEMNAAFSQAALDKMSAIGLEYKRWILSPDACPICEDNADDGAIPLDDEFSSGDDSPPAHPNCRCAVVGARAPEEAA